MRSARGASREVLAQLMVLRDKADWKGACSIVFKMGGYVDPRAYGIAMAACTKAGQPLQALRFLKRKRDGNTISMYNSGLSGCSTPKMTRDWLNLLGDLHIKPHNVTLNTALTRFKALAMYDDAFGVFNELVERGAIPDVKSYGLLLPLCIGGKNYGDFSKALEMMTASGITPNLTLINSCLYACARHKNQDLGWILIELMDSHGIEPSSVTYAATAKLYLECGEYELVEGLVERMKQQNIRASQFFINTVVPAFLERGNFSVVEDLGGTQLLDKSGFATLITLLVRRGAYRAAYRIFKECDYTFESRLCSRLLSGLARDRLWTETIDVASLSKIDDSSLGMVFTSFFGYPLALAEVLLVIESDNKFRILSEVCRKHTKLDFGREVVRILYTNGYTQEDYSDLFKSVDSSSIENTPEPRKLKTGNGLWNSKYMF